MTLFKSTEIHPAIEVGSKFTHWTVEGPVMKIGRVSAVWCVCDCARQTKRLIPISNLRRKLSRSCKECRTDSKAKTHKLSKTVEYRAHNQMLRRCYDKNFPKYPSYGGRGITVCDRWRFGENGQIGFECWLADMGKRPSDNHSQDRIDNNGNYEPSNCRWATRKEQMRNRRTTVFYEAFGKRLTLKAWCEERNAPFNIIGGRIARKWSMERALTTPVP